MGKEHGNCIVYLHNYLSYKGKDAGIQEDLKWSTDLGKGLLLSSI